MGAFWIDAGALRHRLALQAPGVTGDAQGGHEPGWVEVGSLFARVEPGRVQNRAGADARVEVARFTVTLRFRGDVGSGMRFVWQSRALEILGVRDPDGSGRFLVCDAQEVRP